eukprot:CAMPEP_0171210014 /NCGR_PEP_ID=MMETSP0790-20130122/28890_1 /TAXON_ID=2925 /ORGANISM="Alexandrium catenella, Strain OF101" /LENGTH=180 /DNA_ID=CAMNT_0011675637 /DNA_START=122 /DNA_END=664 /DNA_ORIENTATION=+
MGSVTVQLHHKRAPMTCRNFLELAKAGYYDGCILHRVVKGFMCQTGDPDPTSQGGSGGESIYGSTFQDEITADISHNKTGTVSMANAGLNTNSSQFFVTFKACEHLDGKHTIFGFVPESDWQVLRDIEAVKTGKNDRPVKPIKIFACHIDEDPWAGQPLPPGASIPEKPLVNHDKNCLVQ